MIYTDLDKVVRVKLDISKNDWYNNSNIPKIEFNQGDVDTSYLEIEVVNNDVAVDLTNKKIICGILSPRMCKISQTTDFNDRMVVEGNLIKHKLNSDLVSERGTYKIQYSILDLTLGTRKCLTMFSYKSLMCLEDTTENEHKQEIFIEIFQELGTKLNEEQVTAIVTKLVEGGVDLSGYSPIDHKHPQYITLYRNPSTGTIFEEANLIIEDVESGGTK